MPVPALIGGHSTASPDLVVVFIVLGLVMMLLRFRARGRGGGPPGGPWGRGPGRPGMGRGPWGGGSPDDEPTQWDIRKPSDQPSDEPTQWDIRKSSTEGERESQRAEHQGGEPSVGGEEHNSPSDP